MTLEAAWAWSHLATQIVYVSACLPACQPVCVHVYMHECVVLAHVYIKLREILLVSTHTKDVLHMHTTHAHRVLSCLVDSLPSGHVTLQFGWSKKEKLANIEGHVLTYLHLCTVSPPIFLKYCPHTMHCTYPTCSCHGFNLSSRHLCHVKSLPLAKFFPPAKIFHIVYIPLPLVVQDNLSVPLV